MNSRGGVGGRAYFFWSNEVSPPRKVSDFMFSMVKSAIPQNPIMYLPSHRNNTQKKVSDINTYEKRQRCPFLTLSERKEDVPVVPCINAKVYDLPLLLIFKGVRWNSSFSDNLENLYEHKFSFHFFRAFQWKTERTLLSKEATKWKSYSCSCLMVIQRMIVLLKYWIMLIQLT